ncbi:MAG: glycoside hydrolase family 1 protein [Chloroflexi bacterium]|nr:glycoside hydrolase family 1 protein [Chloroflexota bacterium]
MADDHKQSEGVLGEDPFEGMDTEWIERQLEDEAELKLESLGDDPFDDVSMDWLEEDGPILRLAPEETKLVLDEFEADLDLAPAQQPPLNAMDKVVARQTPEPTPVPIEEKPLSPPEEALPVEITPRAGRSRPSAVFHFPIDFRWGVAVSAHQVEGDNTNNDWWAWEQEAGRVEQGHTSGLACDWWRNAEADFDRAAELGVKALRLSIEWSRVEPRAGVIDDAAIQRYAQMLQGLKDRGIEPMVTLHHFTNPRWLADQGGWEDASTPDLFAQYVRRVVESLGKYVDLWCTINEPNIYSYKGYVEGLFPPGKKDLKAALRVYRNMLAGHAAAYRQIHDIQDHARVGLAHNMRIFDPANPDSILDRRLARMTDRLFNQAALTALAKGLWLPPLGFGLAWGLRHTLDWIGLNYYTRDLVAFTRGQPRFTRFLHAKDAELLDGGYGEFYPRGLSRLLERLGRLDLPIYITENGIPDDDDDQRPRYILAHLHQMWRALQNNHRVMGYYHWSLVDNFEWAEGWTPRFGLIGLDPKSQARSSRHSARLYGDIIAANAITTRHIDSYAPELRTQILPARGTEE